MSHHQSKHELHHADTLTAHDGIFPRLQPTAGAASQSSTSADTSSMAG